MNTFTKSTKDMYSESKKANKRTKSPYNTIKSGNVIFNSCDINAGLKNLNKSVETDSDSVEMGDFEINQS